MVCFHWPCGSLIQMGTSGWLHGATIATVQRQESPAQKTTPLELEFPLGAALLVQYY